MMGLRPLSRTFLNFQGGRWSSITRYSGSRSGVVQNLAIEPNLPLYCDSCRNFLPLNSNEVDVVCFLWICFGIYQGIHNLPSLFGRCPRNPKKLSIYALLENYFFFLNIAKTSGDFFKAYNLDITNDKEGCKRTRT